VVFDLSGRLTVKALIETFTGGNGVFRGERGGNQFPAGL